jgi:hypothetical protein
MIETKDWLLAIAVGGLLYWVHPFMPLVALAGAGVFFLTGSEVKPDEDPDAATE